MYLIQKIRVDLQKNLVAGYYSNDHFHELNKLTCPARIQKQYKTIFGWVPFVGNEMHNDLILENIFQRKQTLEIPVLYQRENFDGLFKRIKRECGHQLIYFFFADIFKNEYCSVPGLPQKSCSKKPSFFH